MGLMKGKVQFVIKKPMTENDFMNGDKSLLKKKQKYYIKTITI